ncbi:thioredoxin domain-containing protein [Microbulbifer variabilis]|uniref:thioredoxin domain-containing protein n=1 Tax=Microbulbifer variabilis TaxID=266805 RepID=UPI001CFC8570|nr:thioredoxin domain-containing protein [Microbulbifer variabilis]
MWQLKLLFRLVVLISLSYIAVGCMKKGDGITATSKQNNSSGLAARIDGRTITLQELDSTLELALYDIAEQEYELRLNKLNAWIDKKNGKNVSGKKVEILLNAPEPPRINLPTSDQSIRGNDEAPVTLTVFCSFQSPHCKAIQPTLRRLMSTYKGWVNQAYFDFPLKFHKEGIKAAMAARCADDQGRFWEYHDALYVLTPEIDGDTYPQLIKQLELDAQKFELCLSSDAPKQAVIENRDWALSLGLKNVPVIFINGLYLKGPRRFEQYAYWVEKELRSMGINPKETHVWKDGETIDDRDLPVTNLPLILLGVSESSTKSKSKALIEVKETAAKYYNVGQELLAGASLLRIHPSYVVIESKAGLEKLPLKGKEGTDSLLTYSHEQSAELKRRIEQPLGPGTRKLIGSSGVLTLGQSWLSKQLEQREALEAKFIEAELEVEGYHLMRLEGITGNEFFTALGFQENDVLMRVNDSWVHSGQNTLWEALASGQIIDVAFMRKGLPQRIQYVVEEQGYFEKDAN